MQLNSRPQAGLYQKQNRPTDLLDFAYDTRHRLVSDPRDRYYALLALARRSDQEAFAPDYSLSVETVHRQFEKMMLQSIVFDEDVGHDWDHSMGQSWTRDWSGMT